jgi:type II secretory pathway pseudopilin PulG
VQQRRVNSANDSVLRALQEAQSKAKTQKLRYSVSFRTQNGVPQVAVYPESSTPDNYWKSLGDQVSFKPGQIWLGTNATSSNIAGSTLNNPNLTDPNGVKAVTFDNSGALPTTPTPNLGSGLIIAVAAAQPRSRPSAPITSTRRCVKISTLLGSIQTGKVDNTDACKPI